MPLGVGAGSKYRTSRFLPHFDFVAARAFMFHKHASILFSGEVLIVTCALFATVQMGMVNLVTFGKQSGGKDSGFGICIIIQVLY